MRFRAYASKKYRSNDGDYEVVWHGSLVGWVAMFRGVMLPLVGDRPFTSAEAGFAYCNRHRKSEIDHGRTSPPQGNSDRLKAGQGPNPEDFAAVSSGPLSAYIRSQRGRTMADGPP